MSLSSDGPLATSCPSASSQAANSSGDQPDLWQVFGQGSEYMIHPLRYFGRGEKVSGAHGHARGGWSRSCVSLSSDSSNLSSAREQSVRRRTTQGWSPASGKCLTLEVVCRFRVMVRSKALETIELATLTGHSQPSFLFDFTRSHLRADYTTRWRHLLRFVGDCLSSRP